MAISKRFHQRNSRTVTSGRPHQAAEPAVGTPPATTDGVPTGVPPLLSTLAAVSWRLLVVAIVIVAALLFLARIWVVPLALFVALLLATVLDPPIRWLERRGVPSLLATALVFVSLFAGAYAMGLLVVPAMTEEFKDLGPVLAETVDNLGRWLSNGPLDLGEQQVDRYRRMAGTQLGDLLRSSSGSLLSGALVIGEALGGLLLALVICFFFVKDGPRLQRAMLGRFRSDQRQTVAESSGAAWRALGGYLRGAVAIGLLEAFVIGLTLLLVGSRLVVPVATLTFLGAFFPVIGAALTGLLAVLVALASGGGGDALIVAIVALVVQQLDADLLAPVIYGRTVKLHPVVVLVALATGVALAGVAGAFLAVPLTAMVVAAWGAIEAHRGRASPP